VKDENGDLLAVPQHFKQVEKLLLSFIECALHQLYQAVRNTYSRTGPSPFKDEIAIAKLESMNLHVMTKFGQK
jgi:hypothetical protein